MPRNTTDHTLPSFHVRQVVGTFGCDAQAVNETGSPYITKGAWRYVLARYGRSNAPNETDGIWAFDYQGLENYFMINDPDFDVFNDGDTLSDLSSSVDDFVLYRVRGSDRIGTCYYECEYGYEDCNGDPRDGCEILTSACIDGNGLIGWDWIARAATDGCEVALGYSAAQLEATGPAPYTFSCLNLRANGLNVNGSEPIYCRGGQDGNNNNLGTCQFTCNAGFQDCNGNPSDGCEVAIGNDSCNCISCRDYLPGTMSVSNDPLSSDWIVSQSTCVNNECTLPCDPALCDDADDDWENGCETALAYPTPRNSTAIGTWNCAIWSTDLLLAKKHHIDRNKFSEIFCEGRVGASGAGTCSFQAACVSAQFGGINTWQDCNSDPRDGCEDISRWCGVGESAVGPAPRGTLSDLCSSALRYFCQDGFNSVDQLCESIVTANEPAFDCEQLFRTAQQLTLYHIDNSTVVPYCDRDPAHLETRGDCVFNCATGWANCNNDARDGCEANVTLDKSCDYDCIDCTTLPGVDRQAPLRCIPDPLASGQFKCEYSCIAGAASSSCSDVDGEWQNGCEVALNADTDEDGVFVNQGEPMDCSVMQDEGKKNPELFRHHLHIDLSVPVVVPSPLDPMPAGSIFCNGLISSPDSPFGKCYFVCIPGFWNEDRYSYNGCEAAYPATGGASAPGPFDYTPGPATIPLSPSTGATRTYPYIFGGYFIGDYEDETYINFLTGLYYASLGGQRSPIKLPINVNLMNYQLSLLYAPSVQAILWY